ncbi:MAG TPA: hypothetical protein VIK89_05070 [Cytophagaceae bacterium]
MTNYVLIYRFADKNAEEEFQQKLIKDYPDHQLHVRHGIPYFGFASRQLPAVEDRVKAIIDEINVVTTDKDYVALYYIREEEPDKIMRSMILGPSDLSESDLTKISSVEHENLLNDLFDIEYMKLRFQHK